MPPAVVAMLTQANIVLYPVLIRAGPALEAATRELAASTGGAGFIDAADLTIAVHTAEEDAQNVYTLGYYPAEEALDGKYHRVTVRMSRELSSKTLELHYRPGYLATKSALPAPAPSLEDLLESPLDATGIGLAAQATPDPDRPNAYQVRVSVDLRDIRLERKDGQFTGAFEVSFLFPNSQSAKTKTIPIEIAFSEEQFAKEMERGYLLRASGIEGATGEIFVAVRDRATGAAGSLRIPFPPK